MKPRRAHKQEQMAVVYDREILPIWSQRFGRMLLRELVVPPKAMVLDVGCGTGYPALEILKRMDEAGRIIAIDSSPPMLNAAREKAGALSGRRIFFRSESYAPRLSFTDEVYDVVVSNLGLTEVEDPAACVGEFARVARPGGSVLCTAPLAGSYGELYDLFREVLLKHDRNDALSRLDQWLSRYPTVDEARRWLEWAGLVDCAVDHETFHLIFKSSREFFFSPVIEFGPLGSWKEIAGKGQEMQDTFWQIKEAIDAYFAGSSFSVTIQAGCLRGRKPTEAEQSQEPDPETPAPSLSRRPLARPLPAPAVEEESGPSIDFAPPVEPELDADAEREAIHLGTGEIDILKIESRDLPFDDEDEPALPAERDEDER